MNDPGWIPAYRRIYESEHWLAPTERDPSCRRDAWLDLVQMATHKPRKVRHERLKRGELIVSLRTLAKRWHWHLSRVRRFMSELETGTAIGTLRDTPIGKVYRIVNYDTYAPAGNGQRHTPRHTTRHTSDTGATQEQEVKKLRSKKKETARVLSRWRFVPTDWQPTERHRELARELGVNMDVEEVKFREHEFDKPKSDANRAFNRWLRTSVQYGSNGKQQTKPLPPDAAMLPAFRREGLRPVIAERSPAKNGRPGNIEVNVGGTDAIEGGART